MRARKHHINQWILKKQRPDLCKYGSGLCSMGYEIICCNFHREAITTMNSDYSSCSKKSHFDSSIATSDATLKNNTSFRYSIGSGWYERINWKNGTLSTIASMPRLSKNEPTKNRLLESGIFQIGVVSERNANDMKSESNDTDKNMILRTVSIGRSSERT